MNYQTEYAFRMHNRHTEDDPECEDERRAQRHREEERLAAEIAEYDKLVGITPTENKFDITLESQGCAKLVSNLVERLRTVNPYALTQVLEVCAEAADALEACRG